MIQLASVGPSPPQVGIQGPSAAYAVLAAVRQQLIDTGTFANGNCLVSLDPEIYPGPGSPFCAVCPGDESNDDGQFTGGGRYTAGVETTFEVHIFVRNILDTAGQDKFLLTNADATGVLFLSQKVHEALAAFTPVDANGGSLVEEPVWWTNSVKPYRDPRAREWGKVVMFFRVKFNRFYTNYAL